MSTTPPTPTPPPAKSGSSGCVKVLIIFLIIVVIVGASIGVAAWWAFQKAKQKVEEIKTQVNQGINQAANGGLADVHADEPCPAGDATALDFAHATIPMRVGLTMAKVWSTDKGDLETLTQVQSVDDHSVNVTASSPDRNNPQQTNPAGATSASPTCRTAASTSRRGARLTPTRCVR